MLEEDEGIWWRIIGAYRDRSTATGRGGAPFGKRRSPSCCRFRNHVPAYRNGGGDWLVYESEKLLQSSDGVSASGQIRYTRSAPKDEMAYLAADGSAFPELAAAIAVECVGRQLKRCRERPLVASAGTRCDPAGQWITVSSVPAALTVMSLNSSGSTVWSKSAFTTLASNDAYL